MESANIRVILEALNLAVAHGVPAVITIIEAFDKDEVTLEDVRLLGLRMRPADDLRVES